MGERLESPSFPVWDEMFEEENPGFDAPSVVVILFMRVPLFWSSELDSIIVACNIPSLTSLREGGKWLGVSGGTLRKNRLSIE